MARNPVIQMACDPTFYKKIDDYQKEKGLSNKAETARDLIEFAFRVLEHSKNKDDAVTVMDMLEEILRTSYSTQAFVQLTGNKNIKKMNDGQPYELAGIVEKAKAASDDKTNIFLGNEG